MYEGKRAICVEGARHQIIKGANLLLFGLDGSVCGRVVALGQTRLLDLVSRWAGCLAQTQGHTYYM
jgi:hypothetical protein